MTELCGGAVTVWRFLEQGILSRAFGGFKQTNIGIHRKSLASGRQPVA